MIVLREVLSGVNITDSVVRFWKLNSKTSYEGRVCKVKDQELDVRFNDIKSISLDEKFLVELVTLEKEIRFIVTIEVILDNLLRFNVISPIQVFPASKLFEKFVDKMPVKIKFKSYQIDAEIIRMSPEEVVLLIDEDFENNDKFSLNISTITGNIYVDACVESHTPSTEEGLFEVKAKFVDMRRTEKIRWLRFFSTGDRVLLRD